MHPPPPGHIDEEEARRVRRDTESHLWSPEVHPASRRAGQTGQGLSFPSLSAAGAGPGPPAMVATVLSFLVVFGHLNDKTVAIMEAKRAPPGAATSTEPPTEY